MGALLTWSHRLQGWNPRNWEGRRRGKQLPLDFPYTSWHTPKRRSKRLCSSLSQVCTAARREGRMVHLRISKTKSSYESTLRSFPQKNTGYRIGEKYKDWKDMLGKVKMLVTQSCLTLCNPMDCSLTGSSVHGILQARILEWFSMTSSRGSSQPRDWTHVAHIAGRFFTIWATREAKV